MASYCMMCRTGSWKPPLTVGILSMVLGILVIAFPSATLFVLLTLLGAAALIIGIGFIALALFLGRAGPGIFLGFLALGICSAAIGVYTLIEPGVVQSFLAVLLGAVLIIAGLGTIFTGLSQAESAGRRALIVIGGVVVLLVGFYLIFFPGLSSIVIMQVFGALLFVIGSGMIISALVCKKRERACTVTVTDQYREY
jgi:uncharacterized membrane protein HdeD (DUF308 family)